MSDTPAASRPAGERGRPASAAAFMPGRALSADSPHRGAAWGAAAAAACAQPGQGPSSGGFDARSSGQRYLGGLGVMGATSAGAPAAAAAAPYLRLTSQAATDARPAAARPVNRERPSSALPARHASAAPAETPAFAVVGVSPRRGVPVRAFAMPSGGPVASGGAAAGVGIRPGAAMTAMTTAAAAGASATAKAVRRAAHSAVVGAPPRAAAVPAAAGGGVAAAGAEAAAIAPAALHGAIPLFVRAVTNGGGVLPASLVPSRPQSAGPGRTAGGGPPPGAFAYAPAGGATAALPDSGARGLTRAPPAAAPPQRAASAPRERAPAPAAGTAGTGAGASAGAPAGVPRPHAPAGVPPTAQLRFGSAASSDSMDEAPVRDVDARAQIEAQKAFVASTKFSGRGTPDMCAARYTYAFSVCVM